MTARQCCLVLSLAKAGWEPQACWQHWHFSRTDVPSLCLEVLLGLIICVSWPSSKAGPENVVSGTPILQATGAALFFLEQKSETTSTGSPAAWIWGGVCARLSCLCFSHEILCHLMSPSKSFFWIIKGKLWLTVDFPSHKLCCHRL